jgi:hypothetical protein
MRYSERIREDVNQRFYSINFYIIKGTNQIIRISKYKHDLRARATLPLKYFRRKGSNDLLYVGEKVMVRIPKKI